MIRESLHKPCITILASVSTTDVWINRIIARGQIGFCDNTFHLYFFDDRFRHASLHTMESYKTLRIVQLNILKNHLICSKRFCIIQLDGANMIYSFDELALKFRDYTDVKGKIRREIKSGKLIPITRGLYETDKSVSGRYLAEIIYRPSYLSFDYALAEYSLIPEAVYTYTSATFRKRRTKIYQNHFGTFTYRDVPADVYHLGIFLRCDEDRSYQIATPEKALCDKLYSISPVKNLRELETLLFDDLRIDELEFKKLNMEDLNELSALYHATNLDLLKRLVRRKM